jgi:hypothetical protein
LQPPPPSPLAGARPTLRSRCAALRRPAISCAEALVNTTTTIRCCFWLRRRGLRPAIQ